MNSRSNRASFHVRSARFISFLPVLVVSAPWCLFLMRSEMWKFAASAGIGRRSQHHRGKSNFRFRRWLRRSRHRMLQQGAAARRLCDADDGLCWLAPAGARSCRRLPLYGRYTTPVEVRPGRWRWTMTPPVYGTRLQRVVVAPASRTYDVIPPVTRRVSKGLSSLGAASAGNAAVICSAAKNFARLLDRRRRARSFVRLSCRQRAVSRTGRLPFTGPSRCPCSSGLAVLNAFTSRRSMRCTVGRSSSGRPPSVSSIIPPVVGVARETVLVRAGGYAWSPSRAGFRSLVMGKIGSRATPMTKGAP